MNQMEEMLATFPWLDAHTHVDASHLSARGLDDIILYHMGISDLYAAGCPSGTRLSEDRAEEEVERRIVEALPYLSKARNTWISWGIRIILSNLYDWHEPVTADNWRRLHDAIKERAASPEWGRAVARKAGIARICTELWRGRNGSADDLLDYSLEWAFFSRVQRGQPDIPLYELERAWNAAATGQPISINFDRASAPPLEKILRSAEDVKEAMAHYCGLIPNGGVVSTATHLSTDIDYSEPDDAAMNAALKRRDQATDRERDIYSSYITRRLLAELEQRDDQVVFQFSLGAEPLPYETASRLDQRTIGQLAELITSYPKLRFMCYLSSRHGNQSLCTLARELPNLSLSGYWWHNFFAGAIRQVMEERLDMLPVNKQIGFFSDAYCIDWAYAKAVMVRTLLAQVLQAKVALGQYAEEECRDIAKAILHDSAVELLGMKGAAAR